jgi:hypothetical protein
MQRQGPHDQSHQLLRAMGQAAVYEAPWACLASGPHCSQRNLFGSWRCGSCTHARTCLYEAALLQPHPSNDKATVETRQVYNLVLLLKGLGTHAGAHNVCQTMQFLPIQYITHRCTATPQARNPATAAGPLSGKLLLSHHHEPRGSTAVAASCMTIDDAAAA